MQVTQRALTVLYAGDVVDIRSSTDLVGAIPTVLDQALAGSSCPFQTYAESLTAFARALFALRLEGGRCTAPRTPAGCGFYAPSDQYEESPCRTIAYAGTEQAYHDGIRDSFGIDLTEIGLDPAHAGLTLEVYGAPASAAQLDVQVLCLASSGESGKQRRILGECAAADVPATADSNGRLLYAVTVARGAPCSKLGLIVTRLDTQEALDQVGGYTMLLRPTACRTAAA
jgi:hypothetical protein